MININDHKIILPQSKIQALIKSQADEIVYGLGLNYGPPEEDIILLGVRNGCFPYIDDLTRELETKASNRNYYTKFVRVKSYTGTKKMETVALWFDFGLEDLRNKTVIIVDDIYDTGDTLKRITKEVSRFAKELYWCHLLHREGSKVESNDKTIAGSYEVKHGVFVIGYGMDYNGQYRELGDIYEYGIKD